MDTTTIKTASDGYAAIEDITEAYYAGDLSYEEMGSAMCAVWGRLDRLGLAADTRAIWRHHNPCK